MRPFFCCTAAVLLTSLISYHRGTAASPVAVAPTVTIANGTLQGVHFGLAPNNAAFLGVPYAAPPLGPLRWKRPEPITKWNGTRMATQFGPACPQLPARWLPYVGWNEDCLYLNVWTTQLSARAKLPVIVYFHGGSNAAGYSQLTPLGPALSPLGVVVVSANYRLGPMGFLALPALTEESKHHSSGNYGLLDQLQALKWVRQNISRFGGDPDRVTVMGQSAGAVDICLLMASPLSNGLFHAAILESGECQGTLNEDIRLPIKYNFIDTTGEAAGERLAKDLGLSSDADALEKMRKIPASEILKAWKSDPGLHFDAIVDGWIVPKQPAEIFPEGKQLHIPVLVGSNADEATVFGHNDLRDIADYERLLQEDVGEYWNKEFTLYPVAANRDVPIRSLRLESDEFACGAYSLAKAMTKTGVDSYLYYFTYVDPGKRARLGAHHGEELFFLSDSFPSDWEHTGKDGEWGRLIRGYWVRFAETGNPNFDDAPHWPSYDDKSQEDFELGERVGVRRVSQNVRNLAHIMRQVVAQQIASR
jgi:para-nitrobenzyl esterase